MSDLTKYIEPHVIITAVATILLIIVLWYKFGPGTCSMCYYTYRPVGGPTAWDQLFPEAVGCRQSPISIGTTYVKIKRTETLPPLEFSSAYHDIPVRIRLFNDGHSVTISGCWQGHVCPEIRGGPLKSPYKFLNIRVRWGPNDDEGSEHTINCRRFALEMQATYISDVKTFNDLNDALAQKAVLTISYLFQKVQKDNPFLRPIIAGLKNIRPIYTDADVQPVPLSCVIPAFSSKYYVYEGSLTTPPCTEGIVWIVQSEPLAISSGQVNKFRKLCSTDGPIHFNTRPVQNLNGRDVFFYD